MLFRFVSSKFSLKRSEVRFLENQTIGFSSFRTREKVPFEQRGVIDQLILFSMRFLRALYDVFQPSCNNFTEGPKVAFSVFHKK
jgi:hypothetical protein